SLAQWRKSILGACRRNRVVSVGQTAECVIAGTVRTGNGIRRPAQGYSSPARGSQGSDCAGNAPGRRGLSRKVDTALVRAANGHGLARTRKAQACFGRRESVRAVRESAERI